MNLGGIFFPTPKKNTVCISDLEVKTKILICADLDQFLAVMHGRAHGLGFVGGVPPPHPLIFLSSLFKVLHLSTFGQSYNIWDLNITRRFRASAMHVGFFCYRKIY